LDEITLSLLIKPCDIANRKQIENLSVSAAQRGLIESNRDSLNEADQFQYWRPVGLYDNDLLVGFAMYGRCEEDSSVWLDRLMIASQFQGKGYGKKFLKLILRTIINEYHCSEIYLSYLPENQSVADFYASVGFKISGEKDPNGEIIMCLNSKQITPERSLLDRS
jgi:diamine N-acetyltransferase